MIAKIFCHGVGCLYITVDLCPLMNTILKNLLMVWPFSFLYFLIEDNLLTVCSWFLLYKVIQPVTIIFIFPPGASFLLQSSPLGYHRCQLPPLLHSSFCHLALRHTDRCIRTMLLSQFILPSSFSISPHKVHFWRHLFPSSANSSSVYFFLENILIFSYLFFFVACAWCHIQEVSLSNLDIMKTFLLRPSKMFIV